MRLLHHNRQALLQTKNHAYFLTHVCFGYRTVLAESKILLDSVSFNRHFYNEKYFWKHKNACFGSDTLVARADQCFVCGYLSFSGANARGLQRKSKGSVAFEIWNMLTPIQIAGDGDTKPGGLFLSQRLVVKCIVKLNYLWGRQHVTVLATVYCIQFHRLTIDKVLMQDLECERGAGVYS